MKIQPLAKVIIVLGILIVLSGCTGSVGYSIKIKLVNDQMISDTVFNVTRADLSNIAWIINDFKELISNETIYSIDRSISQEEHSVILQTLEGLETAMTNSSQVGSGAAVQGGWDRRSFYLQFENNNFSVVLNTISGA